MKEFIISLRPKEWIKNLFVVIPLFFSNNIGNIPIVFNTIIAFLMFCLFSSSVYLINDIIDLERDKIHPKKNKRPLAAGRLSKKTVIFGSIIFLAFAVLGSAKIDINFLYLGLLYWFINLFYSLFIKHLIILDVICISIGFILRVIAGGIVVRVSPSHWILLTTLFLSLYLGFAKRRGEIVLCHREIGVQHRPVLESYTINSIDQFLFISATCTIMSYILFTVSEYVFKRFGTYNLVYTIPFVIFGIFRYLYLIKSSETYDSPTEILYQDKPLGINIIIWLIVCIFIL